MTDKAFIKKCKELVADYSNSCDDVEAHITPEEVYVVWSCKTLQNFKALLGAHVHDGRYFEITYNGDKKELYFDAYKKELNKCVPFEDVPTFD